MTTRAITPHVRKPRLFPGVKSKYVPDQAMSIAEMFRRFVRREPLPAEKDGVYVESEYDLEKISHMDVIEKQEVLAEMKERTTLKENKMKAAQEKQRKAEEEKLKAAEAAASLKQSDPKEGNAGQKSPPPGA